MTEMNKTFFVPQLYIRNGVKDLDFYTKAFGATEVRRWTNDDGSIHVAELSINGALFHLHEENFVKLKDFFKMSKSNPIIFSVYTGKSRHSDILRTVVITAPYLRTRATVKITSQSRFWLY